MDNHRLRALGQERSQQFLQLEEAGEAGELRVGEGTAATDVEKLAGVK